MSGLPDISVGERLIKRAARRWWARRNRELLQTIKDDPQVRALREQLAGSRILTEVKR